MTAPARPESARLHAVGPDELELEHPLARADGAASEHGAPVVDRAAAVQAYAMLLRALGRDLASPHLAETPRRAADAMIELLTPTAFEATSFPNDEGYDELVVVTGIPFHSLCEHHLLPFQGVAHVGYLPGERLIGLSKLARIVDSVARELQVQERMSRQIVDRLEAELAPIGAGVVIEAEHLCMSLRGAHVRGTRTVTVATSGALHDDGRRRGEFLARCGHGGGYGVEARMEAIGHVE
ncbi:GTP cyclohydrolase I [Agromyces soli]